MTEHLSAQQVEEWLIGDRPAALSVHVGRCPACSSAIERAEAPLTLFRSAVRNLSVQPAPVKAVAGFRWRPALAFAALLTIVSVPAYQYRTHERRAAASAAAMQDEVLLQQVASGISRSVPAPMEPLAQLMSSDYSR